MTEEQLSALLRLKRHEQPPEGYFEDLLKDIHQRQRAELLQRSLWQIGFERLQTFFGSHSMGSVSYAGAMAGFLVIGVAVIGLMTPGELQSLPQPTGALASNAPTPAAPAVAVASRSLLSLQPLEQAPSVFAPAQSANNPAFYPVRNEGGRAPRYVIDARPASYEPSFNF